MAQSEPIFLFPLAKLRQDGSVRTGASRLALAGDVEGLR
jgi:hypothetical protein